MPEPRARPLVGIPASVNFLSEHKIPQHMAGEKYLRAVVDGAGATPLVIPALGSDHDIDGIAEGLDGLLLPGGRANVEPHHYGGAPFPEDEIRDPGRDATVLPLIRACIERGVPVFGICRGLQEINVALGGSLHYRVHLVPGKADHRMPRDGDLEHKFALRHSVAIAADGYFATLVEDDEVMVNTAHGQGIDRLASGLAVEALAPDGIIEGIRLEGARALTVAVQWHAEWRFDEHALSQALFAAFGRAAGQRAAERARGRTIA
jgi:putative glutamine amidotransferase